VIFQPHLFSRTKDFADAFAATLDMADEIILLPIYPARELPVEGVTSEMLLQKMENKNRAVKTKEEVLQWVAANKNELIITAGAGDIDTLVTAIKEIVNK
jgi:UDP-N-acetylmuramate--alanine ligase